MKFRKNQNQFYHVVQIKLNVANESAVTKRIIKVED